MPAAKPVTTFTVDPDRLSHGVWSQKHNTLMGEGDIAASYSADLIAMHNRVRRSFTYQGVFWVCVGMTNLPFAAAKAYRLVNSDQFTGEATTYAEKTRDCDAARNDPFGFYHGMAVSCGGCRYILTGPQAVFIEGEKRQFDLFDE